MHKRYRETDGFATMAFVKVSELGVWYAGVLIFGVFVRKAFRFSS